MAAPAAKRQRVDGASSGDEVYDVKDGVQRGANLVGMTKYRRMFKQSIEDPATFWAKQARHFLSWFRDFSHTHRGSFDTCDFDWFSGGQLNVSYNCLDRHVIEKGDEVAIIWEGDEPGTGRSYTYREALQETCRIANVLLQYGVRKGDTVAIYLPMIPEVAFTMLACARIGAIHSVVFAGFSADSLRSRILDASSKWVVTADEGRRGGKTIHLKHIVDQALQGCACAQKTFVFERTGADVGYGARDVRMKDAMPLVRPFCSPEPMNSEDPLFLLYTSGSTGKPKGLMHTGAGYLLFTAMTHHYVFDYRPGDIYACVADCGWITGHSYIVYGPLCNGATTVMFESTPMYPNASRYWDLVQRHKITQLYTAPTAIRALMRSGTEPLQGYDLSSLRVLGTVGEPINPAAWQWYHDEVGKGRCAIVDTYWQTETGGHMLTPLPGCTPLKPGSATLPFFGVEPVLLDAEGNEQTAQEASGLLCIRHPWPGIARSIWGDHERFLRTYMRPYPGYYFTGDGAMRDKDGYYWVTGRVDDVVNVSGHRLGTAEIESALVQHDSVAEAAVVGFPHDLKGQGIGCYVTLVKDAPESLDLVSELRLQVRSRIGAFATPDYIILTPSLPKTRSGKIMRRILRKILSLETDQLGDTSTLADPSVVDTLIDQVKEAMNAKKSKPAAGK